jgi:sterol O-acyltransferase
MAAVRYPSPQTRLQQLKQDSDSDSDSSGIKSVGHLRDDLALELTSPLGNVTYPSNLTLLNFIDFLFCPTLCYELEYPRTERTVWSELFYKTLAVFGCIFLLTVTSDEFVLPVLVESSNSMHASASLSDQALILAETTSRLLFPFMVSFLLVFLVIFEYILGAFAEITCEPKFPVYTVELLTFQASRIVISIQTGGTRVTGWSFLGNGIYLYIISFVDMSTPRLEATCRVQWPLS